MHNYTESYRLDGKVALVTGAAGGLGWEITGALAEGGAAVLVTDTAEREAQALVAELRDRGFKSQFRRLDVTVESDWEAAIAATIADFGTLDVVVNNAGIERLRKLSDIDVAEFRRTLDVNVTGTFLGCKHAVKAMRPGGAAGRGGSIVNLSSGAGIVGGVGLSAYGASKGAVRLLTKSVAVECGRLGYGVRCNSVHPGLVDSGMGLTFAQHAVDAGLAPTRAFLQDALLAAHPIGRFGASSDVAGAVRYLASAAADWVTGAEFCIDGGFTAY